jgi:signal transduction histidine kinase
MIADREITSGLELAASLVAILGSSEKVGNSRRLFLAKLIDEIVPPDCRAMALLWIADGVNQRECLTAWAISRRPGDEPGQSQVLRAVEESAESDVDIADRWQQLISIRMPQRPIANQVLQLVDFPNPAEIFITLKLNGGSDEFVGLIQLISERPIDTPLAEKAAALGPIAGQFIALERRRRAVRAIESLQEKLNGTRCEKSACKVSAEVLRQFASAERCVIYRRAKNNKLEVCADTGNTLLEHPLPLSSFSGSIFQLSIDHGLGRIVRVLNIHDREELDRVPGLRNVEVLEEELETKPAQPTSMIFAQVVCPASTGDSYAPLLLCRLSATPHDEFLGGSFSHNDELIVRAITTYLGQILPGLIVQERSQALSEVRSKISDVRTSVVHEGMENVFWVFPQTAFEKIPSVEAAWAVVERSEKHETSWISHEATRTKPHDVPEIAWDRLEQSQQIWQRPFLIEKVLMHNKDRFALVVRTEAEPMAAHDEITLRLIASEMRLRAIGRLDVSEMIRQVAEFRHALRSALTGILGHVGNLQEIHSVAATLPNEQVRRLLIDQASFRKSLEDAMVSADQLERFFEDSRIVFWDLSRAELKLTRVNVADVVREIIRTMRASVEQRLLTVNVVDNYPRNLINPSLDRTLIQIAIANIIDNAVKYSYRRNSIDIEIGLQRSRWFVSVTNIGRYIPPAERQRIFQQFVRLRAARGEQGMPGTGLGLPTVDRIVKIHDSHAAIKVDSMQISDGPSGQRARTTFRIEMLREISGAS